MNFESVAEQRMQLARSFAIPFLGIWLAVSLLAALAAGAIWGTIGAAVGALLIGLMAGGLVVAWSLWSALMDARWMLTEIVSSYLADQDAKREAIERAAGTGAQLNVNAGPGKMVVKNRPITVRHLDGNVTVLDLNQTVNQTDQNRQLVIPAADVRWIAEQLPTFGHSKSKWVGARVELPYSRLVVDWPIYKPLMDALVEAGAIVGRAERASGRLVLTEPAEIVGALERTFPECGAKGITLTLPAETS